MHPKRLIVFGAGKIGRSFIAQIFARNGYESIFIDLDLHIIQALNEHRQYKVITLKSDGSRHEHWVENVRGIDGRDAQACLNVLLDVQLVVTSVGSSAIPAVCRTIAAAARARHEKGLPPFDLILAENMRNAASVAQQQLREHDLPAEAMPGLIEASIGKTSPNVPADEQAADPLMVYADSYNTLIVSADGWRSEPPRFPELYLASSITAYIDRKLFIHNLAHCGFAYFGYQEFPEKTYVHEVAEIPSVRSRVQELIDAPAAALVKEYPHEFSAENMRQYQNDVLGRISNPALRDTLWRVGQDLRRKLGRTERVVASLLLALRHGLMSEIYVQLYRAALSFHARNEQGEFSPSDRQFHIDLCMKGLHYALYEVSEFNNRVELEKNFTEKIKQAICLNKIFV
ncbi:MAG: hypothetical protein ACR2PY_04460 [Salinispira sp.]